MNLRTFVADVLLDFLGVRIRDIVCLQDFPQQHIYDVTFVSTKVCWNTYVNARQAAGEEAMERLEVTLLFMEEEKVIIEHMYNPFADFSLVRVLLQSYCEELRGGDKVIKKFGIWSGKYTFFGRFQIDLSCVGGMRRPPAVFTIGGEKGFLFYPGQPSYCRKCFVYGRTSNECDQRAKCRFWEGGSFF